MGEVFLRTELKKEHRQQVARRDGGIKCVGIENRSRDMFGSQEQRN